MIKNTTSKKNLISVLTEITDPVVMDKFLTDILTPQEYQDIIMRWQIVTQLVTGQAQRVIAKKLGVSIAKITRGSRTLLNPKGGFHTVLTKVKK